MTSNQQNFNWLYLGELSSDFENSKFCGQVRCLAFTLGARSGGNMVQKGAVGRHICNNPMYGRTPLPRALVIQYVILNSERIEYGINVIMFSE